MVELMKIRCRSAVLIETIVAMVIIVSVAAIAVTIFIQTFRTTSGKASLSAESLAEKYIRSIDIGYPGTDSTFTENNFNLKLAVTKKDNQPELALLSVTVESADKKYSIKRFKIIKNEEDQVIYDH